MGVRTPPAASQGTSGTVSWAVKRAGSLVDQWTASERTISPSRQPPQQAVLYAVVAGVPAPDGAALRPRLAGREPRTVTTVPGGPWSGESASQGPLGVGDAGSGGGSLVAATGAVVVRAAGTGVERGGAAVERV